MGGGAGAMGVNTRLRDAAGEAVAEVVDGTVTVGTRGRSVGETGTWVRITEVWSESRRKSISIL